MPWCKLKIYVKRMCFVIVCSIPLKYECAGVGEDPKAKFNGSKTKHLFPVWPTPQFPNFRTKWKASKPKQADFVLILNNNNIDGFVLFVRHREETQVHYLVVSRYNMHSRSPPLLPRFNLRLNAFQYILETVRIHFWTNGYKLCSFAFTIPRAVYSIQSRNY